MPLLVYGVVRHGHPPPSPGAKTPPGAAVLRLVESGELAAAVTEIGDETQLSEDDAAQHLDALTLLLRDGPVLPLAFGTVSPDDDAVRSEVLDPTAAELRQRLEAVDGLVETRLDLLFDESTAMREVLQADSGLRGLAAEARGGDASLDTRVALGEAVSQALNEWRRRHAEALLPGLAACADDIVELESADPLQHRWALLVGADRLDPLDQAVGEVRAAVGTKTSVEYVGPLPVYSFLETTRAAGTQPGSAWGW